MIRRVPAWHGAATALDVYSAALKILDRLPFADIRENKPYSTVLGPSSFRTHSRDLRFHVTLPRAPSRKPSAPRRQA